MDTCVQVTGTDNGIGIIISCLSITLCLVIGNCNVMLQCTSIYSELPYQPASTSNPVE